MKILILVCALATQAPDCQKNTATDVFYAPPSGEGISGCTRQGLLYAAESNLVKPGSYAKVVCKQGQSRQNIANATR